MRILKKLSVATKAKREMIESKAKARAATLYAFYE
jgi:hypothetical protein